MSDLISRSAVIDYLREQAGLVIIEKNKKGFVNADVCNGMMCSIEAFRNFILLLPTVEAKPVVRGEWKSEFGSFFTIYRCSECNCATALGQTNFCPNCGADMRKLQELQNGVTQSNDGVKEGK